MLLLFFEPHITNLEALRKIRANTSCLLSVVGSIMTPEEAESLLEEGSADLIMLGRSTLAASILAGKSPDGTQRRYRTLYTLPAVLSCFHRP